MLIRTEIGLDAASIDSLLRRTFSDTQQAERIQALREEGLLTLGVVATDEQGQVLGYAAFSPLTVNGEDRQWVGLTLLVVDPALRGQEMGKKLIFEGLDTLNEFGYAAVVVQGESHYFRRIGFQAAEHLRCQQPGELLIYRLADAASDELNAEIAFAAPSASPL